MPNLLLHFNYLSDRMVPKLLESYSIKHLIHKMKCLIDNPMGPKVSESPRKFLVSCCKVSSLQQEITPWMMVRGVIKHQVHHVFPPLLSLAHRHAFVEFIHQQFCHPCPSNLCPPPGKTTLVARSPQWLCDGRTTQILHPFLWFFTLWNATPLTMLRGVHYM